MPEPNDQDSNTRLVMGARMLGASLHQVAVQLAAVTNTQQARCLMEIAIETTIRFGVEYDVEIPEELPEEFIGNVDEFLRNLRERGKENEGGS